jgi:ribose 1,5-bisphosphokinase
MSKAPLVYVMGPSGAGKDTLLRFARAQIGGSHTIAFAHRYITRLSTTNDENHIALSVPEFELRRAKRLFAMSWIAHGLRYGIGIEIEIWRNAGLTVVVNGSRAHFTEHFSDGGDVLPVLVTANADAIAARLAARGRERGDALGERKQRGEAFAIVHPKLVTLDNSGPIESAGRLLVKLLIGLARPI